MPVLLKCQISSTVPLEPFLDKLPPEERPGTRQEALGILAGRIASFVVARVGTCFEGHTDTSGPASGTAETRAASSGTVERSPPAGHIRAERPEAQFVRTRPVLPAEADNNLRQAADTEEPVPEAQHRQESRLADPAG